MVLFVVQQWMVYPLRYDLTPFGIVALEFCDNFARLNTILNLWDIKLARQVIYIDCICILAFSWLFIKTSRLIHSKSRAGIFNSFTRFATYLVLIPCVLDALGNISMLLTLNGLRSEGLLLVTSWIAIFKFALAAMVLLYLLVSLLILYAKTKKQTIPEEEEYFGRT